MNRVEKEIREIANIIYNQLGPYLSESAYQRSFELEVITRGYGCVREFYLNETYKDSKGREFVISQLRADLVIFDLDCCVELKVISKLTDKERSQIKRYKRISKCSFNYLINFSPKGLEFETF